MKLVHLPEIQDIRDEGWASWRTNCVCILHRIKYVFCVCTSTIIYIVVHKLGPLSHPGKKQKNKKGAATNIYTSRIHLHSRRSALAITILLGTKPWCALNSDSFSFKHQEWKHVDQGRPTCTWHLAPEHPQLMGGTPYFRYSS